MLSYKEVHESLNYNASSQLKMDAELSFQQLKDEKVPPAQKKAALGMLKIKAENSLFPLEKPEIFVGLAKYYFDLKDMDNSIAALKEAEGHYERTSHRCAVVKWLQGIILWRKIEIVPAYANWQFAVNNFEEIRKKEQRSKNSQNVIWYSERIDKMHIELTKTSENAYEWINKWSSSALLPPTKMIVDEIAEKIKRKEYPDVVDFGLALYKGSLLSVNPMETAEVCLNIGNAYMRMGQARSAIAYLLKGFSLYTPRYYYQGVAKWMLGTAQWDLRSERNNAINSWKDALELFKIEKNQASQENLPLKREWLEKQIYWMEIALNEKMKAFLAS